MEARLADGDVVISCSNLWKVFGEVAGSDEVQRQNELTGRQRGPFQPGPSAS